MDSGDNSYSERKKRNDKSKKNHNVGLPPGTLVYTGTEGIAPVFIEQATLKSGELTIKNTTDFERPNDDEFFWWNINGTHNPYVIKQATEFLGLHRLNGEDILNPFHRPKYEDHEHYIFIIMKRSRISLEKEIPFSLEQVNLVFTSDCLLTAHEFSKDFFEVFRGNLSPNELTNIRPGDGSYLLYRIIDMVVDEYFLTIDAFREHIASIEEEMHKKDPLVSFEQINNLRSDLQKIILAVTPLKEVVYALRRTQNELISKDAKIYLGDVKDNLNQISDSLLQISDRLNNSFEVLLSLNNFKTNEIMKTLTIITTIFMPMTFIASLYGMNMKWMPFANSQDGFWILMAFMGVLGLLMGIYFWRKRWL